MLRWLGVDGLCGFRGVVSHWRAQGHVGSVVKARTPGPFPVSRPARALEPNLPYGFRNPRVEAEFRDLDLGI